MPRNTCSGKSNNSTASVTKHNFIGDPDSVRKVRNGFGFQSTEPPKLAITGSRYNRANDMAEDKIREMDITRDQETLTKNRAGILAELGVKTYLSEILDRDLCLPDSHTCEYDLYDEDEVQYQVKSARCIDPDLLVPQRQDLASHYYILCEYYPSHLIFRGFATRQEVTRAKIEDSKNGNGHENRVVPADELRPIGQLAEVIADA